MSMIKSIKIKNFRQFDKLEVDNFKRVNFLVGKNNCGKTTLLEALYWCADPINMHSLPLIYEFRKINLNQDIISTLFLEKDENKTIDINIKISDRKNYTFNYGLSMTLLENQNLQVEYNNSDSQKISDSKKYNYTVTNTLKNVDSPTHESLMDKDYYKLVIDDKKINLQPDGSTIKIRKFNLSGLYLSSQSNLVASGALNALINESKEKYLIEKLKTFEPKIHGVGFDGNSQILIEIENDNSKLKLPLNLMGDGFIKFFNIVTSLSYKKEPMDIFLIDEIENGLHFKNIKNLISAILKLSKEMNIQMFITTHSYETLKFLSEVMQEEKDFFAQKDEIQVINIANTKLKGFQSYNYSIDGLREFIQNETEIRD